MACMAALQYLESLCAYHLELAEWCGSLVDLCLKRLWHQLTRKPGLFITLEICQFLGLLQRNELHRTHSQQHCLFHLSSPISTPLLTSHLITTSTIHHTYHHTRISIFQYPPSSLLTLASPPFVLYCFVFYPTQRLKCFKIKMNQIL